MGSERSHVDKYLCTVCGHRHSNGWYCKHSIDAKDAEIERLKAALAGSDKLVETLCEQARLAVEKETLLNAQLSASEEFRKSLTERFRRKDDDPGDSPGFIKWVVYLREGHRLFSKADAASTLEAP